MVTIPNVGTYPKTITLLDGTPVELRPLEPADEDRLLRFFTRIPESDRYYLKDNVTDPRVIHAWTANINFDLVIPIVALAGDFIIADGTLHRSGAQARRHIGEVRVVVDPRYRQKGLGNSLIRELLEVAIELGLHKVIFELAARGQGPAIIAAQRAGFREVGQLGVQWIYRRAGVLKEWLRDTKGDYEDLVLFEVPLEKPGRSPGAP